jgi:DNA-binding Lrp family transcriptional regulator
MSDEQTPKKTHTRTLIKELDDIDKEMIRLRLERPTITYREIGEKLDLNLKQVWKRYNEPIFQRALTEFQKKAIDIILDAKAKAARRLVRLVDSENEQVAAKVCLALCADALPAIRHEHGGIDGKPIEYSVTEKRKTLAEIVTECGLEMSKSNHQDEEIPK